MVKTIEEFVSYLRGVDVKLSLKGDRVSCNAPPGVLTDELKAELASRKEEIKSFLRKAAEAACDQTTAIARVDRNQELPVSFSQQRLWFLDQLVPENVAYNIAIGLRLDGHLNRAALERSLREILCRHEILRTNFLKVDGKPKLTIGTADGWSMRDISIEHLSGIERDDEVQRITQQEAEQPFDLTSGALLRATLLTLGEQEHVLMIVMHHIAADGWSLGVFMRELAGLYPAYCDGLPSPLAELPIQYVDYAAWHREYLQAGVLEEQFPYWKQQLNGKLPVIDLPADHPRPRVQTARGKRKRYTFTKELTEKLKALSAAEDTTLFMTLLAGFKALLYRYGAGEDIIVGSATANRDRPDLKDLIGFFINDLVFRTQVSGELTVHELLGRVREVVLQGFRHPDVPFDYLVEALRPERDLNRSPLFQVMFVLQNYPTTSLNLAGLLVTLMEVDKGAAPYDLSIEMVEREGLLELDYEYRTDLFEAGTIARMHDHFARLLEGMVADPGCRISGLPLLSAKELQQTLVDWNATDTEYPRDLCIHEIFASQVSEHPDSIAIETTDLAREIAGKDQMTYRELDQCANQLARRLQKLGVGSETPVGIYLDRSIGALVAILAVLKAGAAYLPLDRANPAERTAGILRDAQARAILTQRHLSNQLPSIAAAVIDLEDIWDSLSSESTEALPILSGPENLAYIMFTSGSKGRPKGVCVTHRNVVRLVKNTTYAHFSTSDVFLHSAPLAFDASTFEIWGSLLNGARLVVNPTQVPTCDELAQILRKHGVTTLWLTAGLFHRMAEDELHSLSSVSQVLAGGDVLSISHVQKVKSCIGEGRIINGYGPTENTTFTCCFPMDATTPLEMSVPIGRPISNTRVYILDTHMNPVPVGIVGELYAGGDGVARGYLASGDLTASKFLSDPFSQRENARMYRTGDLVRYRSDGNIEFVGRVDDQVKIRGFRIELGEIESVLSEHEAVKRGVVVAREGAPGDKRVVAYIVVSESHRLTELDLRGWLSNRLPKYMIPSSFVFLDALPLTPNGKVDRRALPDAHTETGELSKFVAPHTEAEKALSALWKEVLRIEQVGRNDDFFARGGHSLLAVQLQSRIRKHFDREVSVLDLFEHPTLAAMAEMLNLRSKILPSTSIPRVDRNDELPVSFQQQRLWFLDQFAPQSAGYNISGALKLTGALNRDALKRSLQAILTRHEVLRTTFLNVDGKPKLVLRSADDWNMHVVDLRSFPATQRSEEVQRLAREEEGRPFDLSRGVLLRATLLVLDKQEHVLLLTMHHIASDGWSLGVFVHELSQLYPAFCSGRPMPLPELPIQYVDYAAWHRKWLNGGVLASQLPYWKTRLGGTLPILELPADRPRPTVQSQAGALSTLKISRELTDKLKAFSRNVEATLFMTLLSAFKALLYRYAVGEDIIVGSASANRNGTELDDLIGFFVNNLVLRTDLSGNPTPRTLIGRVRDVALNAYEHQDVPFDHLVEALHPQRDLNHSPLFQVMFNLQNFPMTSIQLVDLHVTALEIGIGTSRYDLSVEAVEDNGALKFHFGFCTALFDKSTILRMQEHLRILLEAFVAQPDVPISELPMLTAAEQHMLLKEWNQTSAGYPTDKCIHQLFEEQVSRIPEAAAVVFEGHTLTYRELNLRANSLARYLKRLGVIPDSLVGVWMERSLDTIVSLLAVLKAGAGYVPLDPSFPRDRLEFMVEDSQLVVLLTQEKLASNFPLQTSARVVCVDSDWPEIARESTDDFLSGAKSKNLAYVIYTSGSTGKPKGVQIEHRAVVNFLKSMHNVPGLTERDKFLSVTTLSFDIAGLEIYGPLTIGGQVILASRATALDGVSLRALLEESQATVMQATPATWRLLLETGWRGLPGLRIFCGGEALPRELANKLLETGAEVWNLYGPTETTIWSTAAKVEPGNDHPNIGRPIANTYVYLLDGRGRPVPISVPGEIYIGGDGLARGYLNRPELTQERFVSDPFRNQPGARMYRTGDMGRFRPDGTIQCLGRVDHQVKIRGFRIELGEIEAALGKVPGISQAVVVARQDGSGEHRLVAYVIAQLGSHADAGMLRSHLAMHLPEYMVPSIFVSLESFPLTPNGKVDRKALPSPDGQQLAVSTNYISPVTNKELVIAEVWQEVLKVEKVGLNDNFFDLGGHSLLLVQVQSRLRKRLNRDIMLIDLFQRPTVGSLAELLENENSSHPAFANVKERVRKQKEALDEMKTV